MKLSMLYEEFTAKTGEWFDVGAAREGNYLEVKMPETKSWVRFDIQGDKLHTEYIYVPPELRRQGIATKIYKYAESLGYEILPPGNVSGLGDLFHRNWFDR
jgi:GNAT superfamily N-acetyltransferase